MTARYSRATRMRNILVTALFVTIATTASVAWANTPWNNFGSAGTEHCNIGYSVAGSPNPSMVTAALNKNCTGGSGAAASTSHGNAYGSFAIYRQFLSGSYQCRYPPGGAPCGYVWMLNNNGWLPAAVTSYPNGVG
jgi:hypothetical protein